ncbi:hypothetical protein [Roseivirga pacifica]|uniref:hypothetical protein n=1 Tax=Roseivirga pacifica TaxID=1267423 RepID=UPI003BABA502
MKKITKIWVVTLLFSWQVSMAQNLLNLSGWSVGTGSAIGFSQNGSTSENTREWGIGPHGNRVVLWKASPNSLSDADGGWNSDYISIDHRKTYRFSVWIKKTNSNNGSTYFGVNANNVTYLSGGVHDNPYFWHGDLPQLNKWYLLVGYIHGSGDNSTTTFGRIYDKDTGQEHLTLRDYKFQTSTTQIRHRAYLFYDTNTSDRQYFYAPRVDEVNGNEPTIAELLGVIPTNLDVLRVGTTSLPSGYKLSVGGDAIVEKMKVSVQGQWPDYVFAQGHKPLKLDSLSSFIDKYKHLPGIPSASEINSTGHDLGLLQQKLLEKIEELTLYVIEQSQETDKLKSQINRLQVENSALKLVWKNY